MKSFNDTSITAKISITISRYLRSEMSKFASIVFFFFFFFLEIKYDYDTWSVTFSFFFSILFFMYGNSKGEKNTIVYRCVAVASRLFFLSTPLHPRSIPIFKISVGLSVSGHAWRINIVHK